MAFAAKKSKGPIIDPAVCRCCRSVKKCRLLTVEYEWSDKKEVYSEMFMDCFGLLLSHLDGESKDCGICATCVVRLRDAFAFRQQVLQCEEAFLRTQITETKEGEHIKLEVEVKAEPIFNSDVDALMDDVPDNDDDMLTEKASDANETVGLTKSPNKMKKSVANTLNKVKKVKKKLILKKELINKMEKLKTKLDHMLDKPVEVSKSEQGSTALVKVKSHYSDHETMLLRNAITIVQNSYIWPFRSRISLYICYYCKDKFINPEELREHTLAHSPKDFRILTNKRSLLKVDITRIDCRLCPKPIEDLDTLQKHLQIVHKKQIYPVKNQFISYKLAARNLQCTHCNKTFPYFDILNKHMVIHFPKYTCDVCGSCFSQQKSFLEHSKSHSKPIKYYACEICGKKMTSKYSKEMHVASIHEKRPMVHCFKCDQSFLSYALRNRHLIVVHGDRRTFPCEQCDKVYDTRRTLNDHRKKIHLKLLRHQCDQCDMRFYLPSQLKAHMPKHTGERNFQCEICSKSYPRLKTLREHMKTHNSENRLRCDLCDSTFTQMCSLRSHLKTKHASSNADS